MILTLSIQGNTGYLKYQDTSTGQVVAEHRTGLGACNTLTQNPFNAVLHLGHANGTVTLWTPNLPHPAVRLLAHLGPVSSVAMDPGQGSAGRYMASAGVDGHVKIWDCRSWSKPVREWAVRSGGGGGAGVAGPEVDFSQKGHLAVASGGQVNVSPKDMPSCARLIPFPRFIHHRQHGHPHPRIHPLPRLYTSPTQYLIAQY